MTINVQMTENEKRRLQNIANTDKDFVVYKDF